MLIIPQDGNFPLKLQSKESRQQEETHKLCDDVGAFGKLISAVGFLLQS